MEKYMLEALKQAQKAYEKDEVPIGCIIVRNTDGKIIAKAHNQRATKNNAIMHAEIIAINKACKVMKDWRLNNCTMYVTLEPCIMCTGAILNARIGKVVFGASDEKSGFMGGFYDATSSSILNHNVVVEKGLCEKECSNIIKNFFNNKRKKHL